MNKTERLNQILEALSQPVSTDVVIVCLLAKILVELEFRNDTGG